MHLIEQVEDGHCKKLLNFSIVDIIVAEFLLTVAFKKGFSIKN
jgi:hypothetical protein